MARMRWMFGFHRRLVRRCEWLTFMPKRRVLPADLAHCCHDQVPQMHRDRPTAGAQDPERVLACRSAANLGGWPSTAGSVVSAAMTSDPPRRRGPARRGGRLPRRPRRPQGRASTSSTSTRCPTATPARTWRSRSTAVGEELDGGRRRPRRGVQGDQPRLAHGGAGQLGRDPLADPAGHRRAWWPRPTASTPRAARPRWPRPPRPPTRR